MREKIEDEERIFLIGRLDGYLDALSIVNGRFRECRYFAYINENSIQELQKDITKAYTPNCDVNFGVIEQKSDWLSYLQIEFEEKLLSHPFDSQVQGQEKNTRIYQAAWYVMEMIRVLSNGFEAKCIYQSAISMKCDDSESKGVLYMIPVKNKVLIINLQWRVNV
jgi:hypothetical protein